MPAPFHSKSYIDSDLTVPENIGVDGKTGLIEESEDQFKERFGRRLLDFETDFKNLMIPQSKWDDFLPNPVEIKSFVDITSQGSEPSCVGFSCTQLLEYSRRKKFGVRNDVDFSGMSVYHWIGSARSGAMISDGVNQITEVGALPVNSDRNKSIYEHTHPRTGYYEKFANEWKETAKHFRASKWVTARGQDAIMSTLLRGFGAEVGRQSHAIPYILPVKESGNYYIGYANSWGKNWGDNGWGYDSLRLAGSLTLYILLDVITSSIYVDVPTL